MNIKIKCVIKKIENYPRVLISYDLPQNGYGCAAIDSANNPQTHPKTAVNALN